MALKIAKLTVSLRNTGVIYNRPEDLKTTIKRGDVLEDGKVVRGEGTSFINAEAKERYDRMMSRANEIRTLFGLRFGKGPMDATYIYTRDGEVYEFARQFEVDAPDIVVTVDEMDFTGSLSERTLIEWAKTNKEMLRRIQFGRAEEASDEGIQALEYLATCPAFDQATRDALARMASEAKIGALNRVDLKRGISLLEVKMDAAPMMVPRGRPTVEPAAEPAEPQGV